MSGYNDHWQAYGQDGYPGNTGQQHIQAYYDEEGYDSRSERARRRPNHRARGDLTEYDYSYGYDYWNQSWSADAYVGGTSYSQDEYAGAWHTNGYAYAEHPDALHEQHVARRVYPESSRPPELSEAETVPRSPSPSYLATSLKPSNSADPAPRKLLILDLNGTLLLRAKPPPVPRGRGRGPLKPLKRDVRTRPYFVSFREYLLHPETRKWLDVMIWSSAMPHSVQDMLQHCFPAVENSSPFIAVWARDTLGLSSVDYSRKTQTVKDLRKPWSQLTPEGGAAHSAHTTLLLDDSPLKAYLQPWNHVCVPEYNVTTHAAEVRALAGEVTVSESQSTITTPPASTLPPSATPSLPLDRTLLAVIGILEALRFESNISAWIRAGGLCSRFCDANSTTDAGDGPFARDFPSPIHELVKDACEDENDRTTVVAANSEAAKPNEEAARKAVPESSPFSNSQPSLKRMRDGDTDEHPDPTPAKRIRRIPPTKSSDSVDRSPCSSVDAVKTAQHPSATSPASSTPPSPVFSPQLTRLPPATPGATVADSIIDQPPVSSLDPKVSQSTPPLWFEDASTLADWIERGCSTLSALGIAKIAGNGS